ncbi:glycosyltransferase [Nocardioides panacisoli]|uniref:glycosyltransferase n=1 Tax=Nocardioides panacisoli TaxID=627624 RepID=UPI001C636BE1|nr:glycosyltransferase [Nocardioides panacisoli]QYJ04404.1 glycosyltransferase [Nocardioides panacisoli]
MSAAVPATDVVAILVSHDGATWLPSVLAGLAEQTHAPSGVVAVDTGSKDDSRRLLEEAHPGSVLGVQRHTAYPEAVDAALTHLREQGEQPEWVWLLHDDSRPAPTALAALLAAAADRPDADLLGPKLREWPSLRRLLEFGVTMSGTGRRETGLERGEYDQGQYAEVREVFAVHSAGMLVRRRVLEQLGGFDEHLPIFGNDLDLGWRAASAGHTTLAVPDAVVFHAEAAHRGIRSTPLTGRHTHFQERRAALHTLLVNSHGWRFWWRAVRLVLASLLRVLGFLVVRSPGEAADELAALAAVYARPGQVFAGRRARRRARGDAPPDLDRVRRLFAPWWLPYRHGLDFVVDLVAAASNQAADVAERRRIAAAERDPAKQAPRHSSDEEDLVDSGWVVRFLTDPIAVLLAVLGLAYLVGARDVLGPVVGQALSAAPTDTGAWWQLHTSAVHPVEFGSEVPAPAHVPLLAVLATVTGGPAAAVSLTFLLSVPIALWGAWRFLRVGTRFLSRYGAPRWMLLGGSLGYAVLPLVSGAWDTGRLGIVVVAALLPWLAHAALGFADPAPDRRHQAGWRCGLVLAVGAAAAPVLWWCWLLLLVVALVVVATAARPVLADRTAWLPPVVALLVPAVLLAPWWLPALVTDSAGLLLLDVGRWPTPDLTGTGLGLGRFGDSGAPAWLGLVAPVLALLALVPRPTRLPVLLCWVVATLALVTGLALGSLRVAPLDQQPGLGVPMLLAHASWVAAAVLAGHALLTTRLPAIGRGVLIGGVVLGLAAPALGAAWFVGWGGAQLRDERPTDIPAYMAERAESGDQYGVLVVEGSVADGVTYRVYRDEGLTLGRDQVAAFTAEDPEVTAMVTELATAPNREVIGQLAERGIAFIVMPAPVDGTVAVGIDATGGVRRASAEDRSTRAWRLLDEPAADAVVAEGSPSRTALLLLQGLALPVVVVLSLPTIRRARP